MNSDFVEKLQRREDFAYTTELCVSVNDTSQIANYMVLWRQVEEYTNLPGGQRFIYERDEGRDSEIQYNEEIGENVEKGVRI